MQGISWLLAWELTTVAALPDLADNVDAEGELTEDTVEDFLPDFTSDLKMQNDSTLILNRLQEDDANANGYQVLLNW